jgi:hypothetical protein
VIYYDLSYKIACRFVELFSRDAQLALGVKLLGLGLFSCGGRGKRGGRKENGAGEGGGGERSRTEHGGIFSQRIGRNWLKNRVFVLDRSGAGRGPSRHASRKIAPRAGIFASFALLPLCLL